MKSVSCAPSELVTTPGAKLREGRLNEAAGVRCAWDGRRVIGCFVIG
jgi:hypothetical protein